MTDKVFKFYRYKMTKPQNVEVLFLESISLICHLNVLDQTRL